MFTARYGLSPNKSGYNMYRGWTQTDYQNKHYNIKQKDEGTWDDRGRDGGTNFILRINEQETRLTLQEHNDDDYDEPFNPQENVPCHHRIEAW